MLHTCGDSLYSASASILARKRTENPRLQAEEHNLMLRFFSVGSREQIVFPGNY